MFSHLFVTIVLTLCVFQSVNSERQSTTKPININETNPQYWLDKASDALNERLLEKRNKRKAKNVIVFIGDGMSIPTITAARILKGQLEGRTGEEESLSFENFPWSGLSKTYCVNSQIADSACAANAIFSGVKTNKYTIGVSAAVQYKDCKSMRNVSNHIESIFSWAQKANKSTGLVTTSKITDASPAATYAHTANRQWEDDSDVMHDKRDPKLCEDIASQLVKQNPGKNINVILGGGRKHFIPQNLKDEENFKGARVDDQYLITEWMLNQQAKNATHHYVWNREGLLNISTRKTDYLLGLFHIDTLPYVLDYKNDQYPTLSEMTTVAIEVLRKDHDGFVLFVEGGRIDHAHHQNYGKKALYETIDFSNAVQKAVDMTSEQDTLIVVTSDHAHTMSIGGSPKRGSDILGISGISKEDKLPYTTLSYANGPSSREKQYSSRYDISKSYIHEDNNFRYPSLVPLKKETHGGDDVAVFARGCWSHLFTGVMEQNVIPIFIGYASCLGPHKTLCTEEKDKTFNKIKYKVNNLSSNNITDEDQ